MVLNDGISFDHILTTLYEIGEIMELKENERVDDLQFKGLKIIQNKDGFCFGIDAVLLSDFAKGMKCAERVVDLCTGNGIISILLFGKVDNIKKIDAVEIQKDVANLAKRNVKLNSLERIIEVHELDLKNIENIIPAGSVDSVVVNPPYKAKNSGIINAEDTLTIARHEISCTLEDVIQKSALILKSGGQFYMVHRPERLVDIFFFMRKYKLEPKRMRFVSPNEKVAPNLVLVEGVRSGRAFLKLEKPLFIYQENGDYTEEIYQIYHKKR